MALATSCPRCQTSYRVIPDQLKARRGLVRCGTCHEVFSGIDSLRYIDDPAEGETPAGRPPDGPTLSQFQDLPLNAEGPVRGLSPLKAAPESASAAAPTPAPGFEHPRESFADLSWIETPAQTSAQDLQAPTDRDWAAAGGNTSPKRPHWTSVEPTPQTAAPIPQRPGLFSNEDPATVWNLPAIAEPATIEADPALASSTPSPAAPPPSPGPTAIHPSSTPDLDQAMASLSFLKAAPPRKPMSPGLRLAMALGSGLLALTLLLQGALAGRDWLAAWIPALEPYLASMAEATGLALQAPRALDKLTLESFELQAAQGQDRLTMRAMLRNRADHLVRWPALELSLTDSTGAVVARKVLVPADYLSAKLPSKGLPADTEQSIQVALQALDLKPTGYNVKLFYP